MTDERQTYEEISRERDLTTDEALAYLNLDAGRVPCSRYGRNSEECAPVAIALAEIYTEANGPEETWTPDGLDGLMSLVVNDSDDVLSLILEHGTPDQVDLVADAIASTYEDPARDAGRDAGRAAGSWVIDGNTSEETAREILRQYNDGDPAIYDLEPSPLSGEMAGQSIPELSEEYGLPLDVDDIALAFCDGFSEGFWDEVQESTTHIIGDDS